MQARSVSDRNCYNKFKRQTYRRLQTKIFELWEDYASKAVSAEQLLKACSHLSGPLGSYYLRGCPANSGPVNFGSEKS